jgi:predicted nucleic acid-binding protein
VKVLVDTSAWSLALRRRRKDMSRPERAIDLALRDLIYEGQAMLVGVVRQELLSGTPDPAVFERLREYLRDFPDEPPTVEDYEDAARCDNVCRSAGVAASPVDMLLCAIARRLGSPVLTTDRDFDRYAAHLSVRLLDVTP